MTIGELISKLEKYPKDTLVLVNGYESGYDTIVDLEETRVELGSKEHRENTRHSGDYEDAYFGISGNEGDELAIIIPRGKLKD